MTGCVEELVPHSLQVSPGCSSVVQVRPPIVLAAAPTVPLTALPIAFPLPVPCSSSP